MASYQSQYTGAQIDAAVGAINNVLENNGFVSVNGLDTILGDYLTSATATSTYLTQSDAASTYLTQSDAANTYLTQSNAASTYATQTALINLANVSIVEKNTATGTVSGTGSNMTWTYIKWANGVACCYGTATSKRSGAAAGNVYYASGSDPYWNFPSGLFTEAPVLSISIQSTSGANWLWIGTGNSTTKDKTCSIMPFYYNTYTDVTVTFGLMAWGKWK